MFSRVKYICNLTFYVIKYNVSSESYFSHNFIISIYLEVIVICKKVYVLVVDGTHGTNYSLSFLLYCISYQIIQMTCLFVESVQIWFEQER